eukprot:snap_masked-scaffold969_size75217-processed-gene-0.10 protein:Tk04952 transcript:snap_masked-scaffold969_size75217-processed-gene-0.10-mRNA-1 annotation:"uncharacterized transmembrane protein ddb_g0289901-like"
MGMKAIEKLHGFFFKEWAACRAPNNVQVDEIVPVEEAPIEIVPVEVALEEIVPKGDGARGCGSRGNGAEEVATEESVPVEVDPLEIPPREFDHLEVVREIESYEETGLSPTSPPLHLLGVSSKKQPYRIRGSSLRGRGILPSMTPSRKSVERREVVCYALLVKPFDPGIDFGRKFASALKSHVMVSAIENCGSLREGRKEGQEGANKILKQRSEQSGSGKNRWRRNTGTGDALDTGKGDALDTGTGDALDTGTGDALDTGTGNALDTGTGDALDTGTGDALGTGTGDALGTGTGDAFDTVTGDAFDTVTGDAFDTGARDALTMGTGDALTMGTVTTPCMAAWSDFAPTNRVHDGGDLVILKGMPFIIGGYDNGDLLVEVEFYDEVRDQWEFGTPMLQPKRSYMTLLVNDDTIILTGGVMTAQQKLVLWLGSSFRPSTFSLLSMH